MLSGPALTQLLFVKPQSVTTDSSVQCIWLSFIACNAREKPDKTGSGPERSRFRAAGNVLMFARKPGEVQVNKMQKAINSCLPCMPELLRNAGALLLMQDPTP
jgi:hypothetical protein